MGDLNAVDIAHETHRAVLKHWGCMDPTEEIKYGYVFPRGPTLEGLYIDDHFVIQIVDKPDLLSASGRDRDLIDASHLGYADAAMPRAPEKAFGFGRPVEGRPPRADPSFVVLGTEVHNEPGTAAAPAKKRAELMMLTLRHLGEPTTEARLLRRNVALYTHVFMHRRCCMAVFHRL